MAQVPVYSGIGNSNNATLQVRLRVRRTLCGSQMKTAAPWPPLQYSRAGMNEPLVSRDDLKRLFSLEANLAKKKIPNDERIYAGIIEATEGFARVANDGFALDIERRI